MTRRDFLHGVGGVTLMPWQVAQASGDTPPRSEQQPVEQPAAEAAVSEGVVSREFNLQVGPRTISSRLLSPKRERLAEKPLLLLSLALDRETALNADPYSLAAKLFVARGHRALSFDLPAHGRRVDKYGEGIQGWRNAWVDGADVFTQFVAEAAAVIDRCIQEGYARAGRVVLYGISRGGYLALRLMAADARIAGAAAIAPVTDWRALAEFSADRDRGDLAGLELTRYADALAGKRVFLVIGTSDHRVSTASCCRFFLGLLDANARHGQTEPPVEFHCSAMMEPGHSVDDSWRRRGAEFLLAGT